MKARSIIINAIVNLNNRGYFALIKFSYLKRTPLLVLALAIGSLLTGYLLSSISFVGRAGINLAYTQYGFLKSWWKGALLVFIVWMILFLIQWLLLNRARKATANIVQVAALLVAVAGLFFCYSDFRNTISHRWLGERFHLGVYLFWLGWIVISVFILLSKRTERVNAINHESFN